MDENKAVLKVATYRRVSSEEQVDGYSLNALITAGYTAVELKQIMVELDYNRFKDNGLLNRVPLAGPLARKYTNIYTTFDD